MGNLGRENCPGWFTVGKSAVFPWLTVKQEAISSNPGTIVGNSALGIADSDIVVLDGLFKSVEIFGASALFGSANLQYYWSYFGIFDQGDCDGRSLFMEIATIFTKYRNVISPTIRGHGDI